MSNCTEVAFRVARNTVSTHFSLLPVLFALGAVAGSAYAEDRADIDTTQILGSRELPKVLYIVPWKKPTPAELSGRAPSSLLDEVLAPVDREVFRRQLAYGSARSNPAATAAEPTRP